MNRLPAILATILLLAVIYAFALWLVWEPWKLTRGEWTMAEKGLIAQRMKYHGISGCEFDGKVYTFVRNGERCNL